MATRGNPDEGWAVNFSGSGGGLGSILSELQDACLRTAEKLDKLRKNKSETKINKYSFNVDS